jgi:hypothetical protein
VAELDIPVSVAETAATATADVDTKLTPSDSAAVDVTSDVDHLANSDTSLTTSAPAINVVDTIGVDMVLNPAVAAMAAVRELEEEVAAKKGAAGEAASEAHGLVDIAALDEDNFAATVETRAMVEAEAASAAVDMKATEDRVAEEAEEAEEAAAAAETTDQVGGVPVVAEIADVADVAADVEPSPILSAIEATAVDGTVDLDSPLACGPSSLDRLTDPNGAVADTEPPPLAEAAPTENASPATTADTFPTSTAPIAANPPSNSFMTPSEAAPISAAASTLSVIPAAAIAPVDVTPFSDPIIASTIAAVAAATAINAATSHNISATNTTIATTTATTTARTTKAKGAEKEEEALRALRATALGLMGKGRGKGKSVVASAATSKATTRSNAYGQRSQGTDGGEESGSSEAEYEPEYQEDPNKTYCCDQAYDDDREYVGCSAEVCFISYSKYSFAVRYI